MFHASIQPDTPQIPHEVEILGMDSYEVRKFDPPKPSCGVFIEVQNYTSMIADSLNPTCQANNNGLDWRKQLLHKDKWVYNNGYLWKCFREDSSITNCAIFSTDTCPSGSCALAD